MASRRDLYMVAPLGCRMVINLSQNGNSEMANEQKAANLGFLPLKGKR